MTIEDGDPIQPAGVHALKGVAYNAPPTLGLLRDATRIAESIGQYLGPNGGIVGVKTDAGVNGAIVLPTMQIGDTKATLRVAGWIGKNWGKAVTGGMFVLNF